MKPKIPPEFYRKLFPTVRQYLWPPDGKPPEAWDERREGSVLGRLLVYRTVSQIEVAILGLAKLRDSGRISWLQPGGKVTSRALYNTRSGVSQMFELATAEYWKAANTRKKRPDFTHISDVVRNVMDHQTGQHTEAYRWYLKSPEWKERRLKALIRADYRCERCNKFGLELQVHHLSYANLGHERDDELQVVCVPCHGKADTERRGAA